jgi:TP901 family phage tail tape measure protein
MGLLGSLGSLNVLLSADTAQFSSAMDKAAYTAERDLQRISRSAKINGQIMTAMLVAAATAFAVKMNQIIRSADEMGKMAQSLGMTAEELSKLKYAAELSGVSVEELRTAFARLNKNAFENIKTFQSLGVSVKDSQGAMRSNYEILGDLAERFKNMSDGIGKAAAAQLIFGKTGANLIPLLNQGRDGLKQLGDEAERLGIVIDTKTAKSAELFNDNMLRLSKATEGAFISIGSKLIPVLTGLTENLKSSAKQTDAFAQAGKGLSAVLVSLVNAGMVVGWTFNTVAEALALIASGTYLISHGKFKQAMDNFRDSGKDVDDSWDDMAKKITANWDLLSDNAEKTGVKIADSMSGPMVEFTKDMEEASKRIDSMAKGIGNAFGSAFDKALLEGKKFKDVMIGLLKDIEAAIFKSLISQRLADSISSGISNFFSPSKPNVTKTVTVKSSKYGNIFDNGNIQAFASGGIIGGPVMWPMAGGKSGLAGEAGKEAILPLTRTSSGDLGVKTDGANRTIVNVYAPAGSDIQQDSQQEGGLEKINIYIDKAVAGNIGKAGSDTHRAMKNTFGLGQVLTKR